MKKLNIGNTVAIAKDPIATDRASDKSELIPAKAKADTNNYSNKSWESDYIDDEGIVNNYAAENQMRPWQIISHLNNRSLTYYLELERHYL